MSLIPMIIMALVSAVMTIVTSVAVYKITKYFKSIEVSGKIREIKRQTEYRKFQAMFYAFTASLEGDRAHVFNQLYKDKLIELEKDDDRINQAINNS